MKKQGDSVIEKADGDDFTKVTFSPDLKLFKMQKLDDDIVSLISKRAYDIAGTTKGVTVFLNGKKLPVGLDILNIDPFLSVLNVIVILS